jgi:hypothetical protein
MIHSYYARYGCTSVAYHLKYIFRVYLRETNLISLTRTSQRPLKPHPGTIRTKSTGSSVVTSAISQTLKLKRPLAIHYITSIVLISRLSRSHYSIHRTACVQTFCSSTVRRATHQTKPAKDSLPFHFHACIHPKSVSSNHMESQLENPLSSKNVSRWISSPSKPTTLGGTRNGHFTLTAVSHLASFRAPAHSRWIR